jgi:serine/threonine protein kinase
VRPAGKKSAGPSFSLKLPSAEKTEQPILLGKSAVDRHEVEHLIVDLEGGTMDSPFISTSTSQQFPSAPGSALPSAFGSMASMPSADDVAGQSYGQRGAVPSVPVAMRPPLAPGGVLHPPADPAAPVASPNTKKNNFFRVDDSNLYVFMAGGSQAGSSDDLLAACAETVSTDDPNQIKFADLEIGTTLGSGAQGTVRAVTHGGANYALKKISVSQALDRTQADVERQARKNGIVRELQMVANRARRSPYMMQLHNAYFRRDDDESALHILMERMSFSVEDINNQVAALPYDGIRKTAQRTLGPHFGGDQKLARAPGASHYYKCDPAVQRLTPMPEAVIGMIAHDALKGLAHMHDTLRFVHTDIKPANLMLCEKLESFKLADFGCSQPLPAGGQVHVSNVLLGTKLYMSPERAAACYGDDGGCFNGKADVWSLAVTLLELAAGAHPYETFREEFWTFAEHLRMPQFVMPEHCSSHFVDFLTACFAEEPEDRPSAAALLESDFVRRYSRVPRGKLRQFVRSVRVESSNMEKKLLQTRFEAQMNRDIRDIDKDKHTKIAKKNWRGFEKGVMGQTPEVDDVNQFPSLGD